MIELEYCPDYKHHLIPDGALETYIQNLIKDYYNNKRTIVKKTSQETLLLAFRAIGITYPDLYKEVVIKYKGQTFTFEEGFRFSSPDAWKVIPSPIDTYLAKLIRFTRKT